MDPMLILIFIGVFVLIALPLLAVQMNASQREKKVRASLNAALAHEKAETIEEVLNLRKDETFSKIPWLNRKLLQFELAPLMQRLLDQAEVKWTAGKLMLMTAVSFTIPSYILAFRFHQAGAGLALGLVLGAVPMLWVLFQRHRRFGKFEEQLPEALDLMVSGLRAGHSLIAAIGLVSRECPEPIGGEWRICFEEQNYGLELKAALENMLVRIPLSDLQMVATAILIQKESGGNLAEVLDKTSASIRERFRLRREVKVKTAQGRLTGAILTVLPIALGLGLWIVNPEMMSILWTRPIGMKLLWVAAGMTAFGGLVIHKIVSADF